MKPDTLWPDDGFCPHDDATVSEPCRHCRAERLEQERVLQQRADKAFRKWKGSNASSSAADEAR